jgi:hypothetical protein
MTLLRYLNGYDPNTEVQKFSMSIPTDILGMVKNIVPLNKDDPHAYYSYELSDSQARSIANIIKRVKHLELPSGLAFYLEACEDD